MPQIQQPVDLKRPAVAVSASTTDSLISLLRTRFNEKKPFTWIGSTILVCVNPFAPDLINDRADDAEASPEVLAENAYAHVRGLKEDQVIIASGESGSGKTTLIDRLSIHLLALSSSPTSLLPTQLQAAITILNHFGSARTPRSPSTSRFGRYFELQFDSAGALVGGKILTYFLERERVTKFACEDEESGFRIFYELLSGCDKEDRKKLGLHNANTPFKYLPNALSPCGSTPEQLRNGFGRVRASMRALGFGKKTITDIFAVLAAILHLGNLEFVYTSTETASSGGNVKIKNRDCLSLVSSLLLVQQDDLESALTVRTVLVGDTMCSDFLDTAGSERARDELAKVLYALVFDWIVDQMNEKLDAGGNDDGGDEDDGVTTVGLVDMAGFEDRSPRPNGFEQFCINYADERLHAFVTERLLYGNGKTYREEGLTFAASAVQLDVPFDDARLVLYDGPGMSLSSVLDDQANRSRKGGSDATALVLFQQSLSENPYYSPGPDGWAAFRITHYTATQTGLQPPLLTLYDVNGFVAKNRSEMQVDFVKLFAGQKGGDGKLTFAAKLFSDAHVELLKHPLNQDAVVAGREVGLKHKPSIARRKSFMPSARNVGTAPSESLSLGPLQRDLTPLTGDPASGATPLSARFRPAPINTSLKAGSAVRATPTLPTATSVKTIALSRPTVLSGLRNSLDVLIRTIEPKRSWHLFCIRPNLELAPLRFTDSKVWTQIIAFRLPELVKATSVEYTVSMPHADFWQKYGAPMSDEERPVSPGDELQGLDLADDVKEKCSQFLERRRWGPDDACVGKARVFLTEKRWREIEPDLGRVKPTALQNRVDVVPGDFDAKKGDIDIEKGTEMPTKKEKKKKPEKKKTEEPNVSGQRRCWLGFTKATTWWVPEWCLIKCGGIQRADVRMAWREKFALCVIVLLLSGLMLFFVEGLGRLLCPQTDLFLRDEIRQHKSWAEQNIFVSWNGYVYDVNSFVGRHPDHDNTILTVAGEDASALFPRTDPVNWNLFRCPKQPVLVADQMCYSQRCNFHGGIGCCHSLDTINRRINVYKDMGVYKIGTVAYPKEEVYSHQMDGNIWILVNGNFYDVSLLVSNSSTLAQYFPASFIADITYYRGQDASGIADRLAPYMNCLQDAFFVGTVDTRLAQAMCHASEYILYGTTAVMVGVLVIKFLAALQLGSKRQPESFDKFVILQVPCYTEGEASLRKTIDSLALLEYFDTRKLLFVIADGMVKGAGNDLSTPDICCKILGVDPDYHRPQAKSYIAISDGYGPKQHNKAKVYGGLYQVQARAVPFVLVVKCGIETETQKPGNRGKRDSQMILMKFLNKVHFQSPMTPLDLEIYHNIKNVIGVDPYLYEYILMVDADTEVAPDGLNRLISCMVHDGKTMGICGETRIANEKESWVTMMQVYEYYISHHMAKAFESLFGSVTCLPGCYCMYRIRTPEKAAPLLIHNEILSFYEECNVDTLHKKNLLSLGEDRYLTTLMLKTFPEFRNKFTPDARCYTIVPEKMAVLLSQRRRWINSTIHNLFELLFIPQMCGCMIFSMRAIVFLDLFATLIMPATTAYLGFLIYRSVQSETAPIISLVMMGVGYGLQVIIFILKREFQHIGWLILNILAMPVFAFYLPLYSFWHFDDFRWGNTRMIAGGGTEEAQEEGAEKFDATQIPLQTWADYDRAMKKQAELSMSEGVDSSPGQSIPISVHPSAYGMTGYRPGSIYGGRASNYGEQPPMASQFPPTFEPPSSPGTYYPHAYVGSYAGSVYNGSEYGGTTRAVTYGPAQMSLQYAQPRPYSSVYQPGSRDMVRRSDSNMALDELAPRTSLHKPWRSTDALVNPVSRPDDADVTGTDENGPWMGGVPSDRDLLRRIQHIIATSDWQYLTKTKVREELANYFGTEMGSRRQYINEQVDRLIKGGSTQ
ncbi:hypothetical protein HK104_010490 [Borealophlyctis nickersoniae]|nr:hypothetical protein HK104_010490 [Borealophlyctis nickersoniae]